MRPKERIPLHSHSDGNSGGPIAGSPGAFTSGGGSSGGSGGGGTSGPVTASAVSILDTGGYYAGTDVEAALAELGVGGAIALDDLTDVTITSPAAADRLRYDGATWVNANLHDEPMIASDGSVMTDGLLNPMMHEVAW